MSCMGRMCVFFFFFFFLLSKPNHHLTAVLSSKRTGIEVKSHDLGRDSQNSGTGIFPEGRT